MKILVLGHGGHGKGTFCHMLEEAYEMEAIPSSLAALPAIWPVLRVCTSYASPEQAYAERRYHRQLWKELITLYNTPDKATLARELLKHADIYDGMRCAEEYEASKHLFDLIFWIDARERVESDPTMSIPYDNNKMFLVNNNADIDGLRRSVEGIVDLIISEARGRIAREARSRV